MARKSKSKKKDKPLYDEDGKWVDQDSRVLSGIRRAYRLSPQMGEVLAAARVELPPKILKNGKPGKRNQIRYRCAVCEGLFSQNNVQVDHIDPATPLHTSIKEMTWDEVVDGIFCGVDNLQVICSTPMVRNGGLPSCHAKKSREENFIRKKINELKIKLLEKSAKVNEEHPGSLHGALLGLEIRDQILGLGANFKELEIRFKEEYRLYRIELEEKRLAKEERKRIREEKRLAKDKK